MILSLALSLSVATFLEPRYQFVEEWHLWKSQHSKSYVSEREELERHLVWLSNREYILQHNANYREGVLGFKLALNRFADLVINHYIVTQH